ncbi:MAG: hypothetical protein HYX89_03845 [Chloroflexi bacterium]|nr:hypothetical protein [Chloroflexota bacterium]
MESPTATTALLLTVLLLGLIHGVDWDHIAAISDITGTVPERRRGFLLASLYVFGHAFVVTALGVLAILVGLALPEGVDGIMEKVIGVTLIFLATWVVYSLFQRGGQFQLRSRWMLLLDGLRAMVAWVAGRLQGNPQPFQLRATSTYGVRTAFTIGMLHGIGAETASQAFLFLAVAGLGGRLLGSLMLIAFVLGLVLSNSGIALAMLYGFQSVRRNDTVLRIAGGFVAAFSLVVGIVFVTGQATLLPNIIGWAPSF